MSLLVELAKMVGLPSGYEKVMVFIVAIFFGVLMYWNSGWYNVVVGILTGAASAVASYEVAIKPAKSVIS